MLQIAPAAVHSYISTRYYISVFYVFHSASGVKEYCQLESFSAKCARDEVIIITSAQYGRMRLGHCVKINYGSLGCAADVLPEVDRKCSGRQECEFPVASLHGRQPCPGDLTPFLEASYTCIKGKLVGLRL